MYGVITMAVLHSTVVVIQRTFCAFREWESSKEAQTLNVEKQNKQNKHMDGQVKKTHLHSYVWCYPCKAFLPCIQKIVLSCEWERREEKKGKTVFVFFGKRILLTLPLCAIRPFLTLREVRCPRLARPLPSTVSLESGWILSPSLQDVSEEICSYEELRGRSDAVKIDLYIIS